MPGCGNIDARIALVGEAPGQNEDKQGHPFVGAAGQRLDLQLEAAGIRRSDIWIGNRVQCRPLNNDLRPYPDATIKCPQLWLMPTLARLPQLRCIVAMGATAGDLWFPGIKATALSTKARMWKLGARPYAVVGSFHPSYTLRGGSFPNDIDKSITASLARASYYAGIMELHS